MIKIQIIAATILFAVWLYQADSESLKGRWISQGDSQSTLIITDRKFIKLYGSDTTYAGSYSRSSASCDSNYYKGPEKLDFLKLDDGTCFEITGVTQKILAYRYTPNGRLHVFRRLK
jgi:hypothetical protein